MNARNRAALESAAEQVDEISERLCKIRRSLRSALGRDHRLIKIIDEVVPELDDASALAEELVEASL